jgi:hypothetical protein
LCLFSLFHVSAFRLLVVYFPFRFYRYGKGKYGLAVILDRLHSIARRAIRPPLMRPVIVPQIPAAELSIVGMVAYVCPFVGACPEKMLCSR